MIQPTRSNLLLLRDRLRAVENCTVILQGRRQALIREFLRITRPLLQSRQEIAETYARAIDALQVGTAREGVPAVRALAVASRREIGVEVAERNLLGLRYRDLVRHESVARELDERPRDFYGGSAWLDRAVDDFEGIVEEMLELASYEGKFRRLAEELVRLARRIRILEERVAPTLRHDIRALALSLAEREREGYYRLKRFKENRSAKDVANAVNCCNDHPAQ